MTHLGLAAELYSCFLSLAMNSTQLSLPHFVPGLGLVSHRELSYMSLTQSQLNSTNVNVILGSLIKYKSPSGTEKSTTG